MRFSILARCLRQGGVIAYPTETVYGLGCDPLNSRAVARLLTIKQRDVHKGLILIAANATQLLPFVQDNKHLLERLQPSISPITWLLPASSQAPEWITGGHDNIAVRITTHPLAAELCRAFNGAIVSTSANRSGLPSARNVWQVRRNLGKDLDNILSGQPGPFKKPSEIREAISGRIIRSA